MKKYNDTDLREALRRREAKRPQTEVPADFLDNVLQDIECQKRPRHTWHMALTAIAAAASIALFMILSMQPEAMPEATLSHTVQKLGAKDTLTKKMLTEAVYLPTARLGRATSPSRADSQSEPVGLPVRSSRTKKEPTDSLDYYIAQMEAELAGVRDSCYLAQVERMVLADEALSQLINEMTNQKQ
jgi:hypothetical protein